MKNITVTVDDDTYRRARIRAAELDTSVSALVKAYLADLSQTESDFERLKRQERELRQEVGSFSGGENVPRDLLYENRR